MNTKEAAKKVRRLVEANKAFIAKLEELGAHTCAGLEEINAALPDADKATEVLAHRFP